MKSKACSITAHHQKHPVDCFHRVAAGCVCLKTTSPRRPASCGRTRVELKWNGEVGRAKEAVESLFLRKQANQIDNKRSHDGNKTAW